MPIATASRRAYMVHMTKKPQVLEHDQHFHLRVGDEFFQRLDDLRALERPMPSRAEWIRRVIDEAYVRQIASRVHK